MENPDRLRDSSVIRVLVVDDLKMMRNLLYDYANSAADIEVVGFANNGRDAVDQALKLNPDVVLMDIEMPEMNGIEAIQVLRERKAISKILVVSASYEDRYLVEALRQGAMGYLLKTSSCEELVSAIRGVHSGKLQFGSGVLQRELSSMAVGAQEKAIPSLTTTLNGRNSKGHRPSIKRVDIGNLAASGGVATLPDRMLSSDQIQVTNSTLSIDPQELASELSQIRAGYWVLRSKMQTMRTWIESLSIGLVTSVALTVILVLMSSTG